MSHIHEFSRRKVTYPEDSLRAFLGILGYFTRLEVPINHIWGVPVCGNRPLLEWKHGSGGFIPRSRVQPNYALRHPIAPSWSWAGWASPVSYVSEWEGDRALLGSEYYTDGSFDCTVVTSSHPDNLDMESCGKLADLAGKPKLLRIAAPIFKLRLTNKPHDSFRISKWYGFKHGRKNGNDEEAMGWQVKTDFVYPTNHHSEAAMFDISATMTVAAEIHMDTDISLEDGTVGLLLARTGWDDWSSLHCGNGAILVLKEVDDHYERVGIIYLAGGSKRHSWTIGKGANQWYTDHSGTKLDRVVLFDNVLQHKPGRPAFPPGVEDPGLPPWIRQTERREILLG